MQIPIKPKLMCLFMRTCTIKLPSFAKACQPAGSHPGTSCSANSLACAALRQRRGRALTRSLLSGMCSSTQTNAAASRIIHLFGTRSTWIISRRLELTASVCCLFFLFNYYASFYLSSSLYLFGGKGLFHCKARLQCHIQQP